MQLNVCETVTMSAMVNFLSLQVDTIADPEVKDYFCEQIQDAVTPEELFFLMNLVCCATTSKQALAQYAH